MRTKARRLLLLNDRVVCVAVAGRPSEAEFIPPAVVIYIFVINIFLTLYFSAWRRRPDPGAPEPQVERPRVRGGGGGGHGVRDPGQVMIVIVILMIMMMVMTGSPPQPPQESRKLASAELTQQVIGERKLIVKLIVSRTESFNV